MVLVEAEVVRAAAVSLRAAAALTLVEPVVVVALVPVVVKVVWGVAEVVARLGCFWCTPAHRPASRSSRTTSSPHRTVEPVAPVEMEVWVAWAVWVAQAVLPERVMPGARAEVETVVWVALGVTRVALVVVRVVWPTAYL